MFSEESLLGFEGAPITDDHPSVMVDISNAKTLTKGTVLSVGRRDGDHVAVSLVITDPDLIRKVESGKRQLSTGYYVHLDETPGIHPEFGRYDAKQIKVGPVNHLAVVERGRAGTASLRMDSADGAVDALVEIEADVGAEIEARLDAISERLAKLDGGDDEIKATARSMRKRDSASDLHVAKDMPNSGSPMTLEQALARITELEAKLDALEDLQAAKAEGSEGEVAPAGKKCPSCGEMNAADATTCAKCGADLAAPAKTDAADLARLEGERDAARKDADDAKAALAQVRKDADDSVTAKVREALDVLTKSVLVLGKGAKIKLDGKDVDLLDAPLRAVKCAVIKHVTGRVIEAAKHDAYVEALFENAIESHAKGADAIATARKAVTVAETAARADAAPVVDPEKKAADDMKNSISSAWMATETK